MIRKDPPLDQTGGRRDEEKEGRMHQPALYLNQLPGNKTLPAAQGNAQSWISALAKQTDARSLFNELLDTPIDFSNFIMNRLGVDTLTPELLAGPTYELMRGSCNSLTELEYHLEEVYKAMTDQRIIAVTDLKIVEWHNYKHLDWILVRRDDDKIFKFKEGDFKRLSLQDIEDMLLLLVQGKLSNLTVEERFAFNVSLRMFTRSSHSAAYGRSSTRS
nr:hypothetical protein [Tanacetum cinerariifolium]